MRCIRDEITADFFGSDQIGPVMRDQNLPPVAERHDLKHQITVIELHFQRLVITPQNDIVDKRRNPYQIGDTHILVAFQIETEMLFRHRIAPFQN